MRHLQKFNSRNKVVSTLKSWAMMHSLNRQAIEISQHIEVCAQFWTQYLTIFFGTCVTEQTYLAYICFFVEGLSFEKKYIFFYALVQMELFLFVVIEYCARVVKFNQTFEKQNRHFYLLCIRTAFPVKSICLLLKVRDSISICFQKFIGQWH